MTMDQDFSAWEGAEAAAEVLADHLAPLPQDQQEAVLRYLRDLLAHRAKASQRAPSATVEVQSVQ